MKIRSIFFCIFIIFGFFSCQKNDFNYPAGTVGSSKIIYFPSIATIGSKVVAFVQGSAYTDQGATATLNGTTATYTTNPMITSSTAPGVYDVIYTAANAQGFTASDFRVVVVIPSSMASDPVVSSHDFSGTYTRAATGATSTWTKIGPGTYTVENVGGATSGVGLIGIAENTSGFNIVIPPQTSPYYGGTISTSDKSSDPGGTPVTYNPGPPAHYAWEFNAPNYGTSVRTFSE